MLQKAGYRNVVVALVVALLSLGVFVFTVGAVTKTPPYVVSITSTGEYSTPNRVGVDPVTGRGYVLDGAGRVWVFSGTEVVASPAVALPTDIAVDPGRYVYVTSDRGENPVTVMDAQTGDIDKVYIGSPSKASGAVAVLTSTHRAYVALPDHDAVAVLSGTEVLSEAIPVGAQPVDVAADPNTGYVYVVNQELGFQNGTVSVLQGTRVIEVVEVGGSPIAIDVNPKTGLAYVVNSGDNTVTIIDSTDSFAKTSVTVDTEPADVAVNPRSGQVYVANAGSTSLSVLENKGLATSVTLGDAPQAVDVNPVTGYVYVVGGTDVSGTITVLSSSLASETYVPVGHSPQDVGVLPLEDGDWAYATMYKGTGGDEGGRVVILGRSKASRFVIDPGDGGGTFECEGSGGQIDIVVPPQEVNEAIDLICTAWEPDTGPHYLFAGQGFLLKAYLKGAHQPGFVFDPPASASILYPTPLPPSAKEADLELRLGVPDRAWGTEGIAVTSPPAQGSLEVALSHLPGEALAGYAVVVPRTFVYMPLIVRR